MIFAIVFLTAFLLFFPILIKLYKVNSKIVFLLILLTAFIASAGICVFNPKMHKPFSVDVIEYFVKINDDGSVTTTKQITKTVIKDKANQEEVEK